MILIGSLCPEELEKDVVQELLSIVDDESSSEREVDAAAAADLAAARVMYFLVLIPSLDSSPEVRIRLLRPTDLDLIAISSSE